MKLASTSGMNVKKVEDVGAFIANCFGDLQA
jgi:hypothetical protein